MNNSMKRTAGRLIAVGLVTLGTALAHAAAPALNGALDARPLTPQEKKDYSLTALQVSGGLDTAGVGQPFYLDALANRTIPASNITVAARSRLLESKTATSTLVATIFNKDGMAKARKEWDAAQAGLDQAMDDFGAISTEDNGKEALAKFRVLMADYR